MRIIFKELLKLGEGREGGSGTRFPTKKFLKVVGRSLDFHEKKSKTFFLGGCQIFKEL